ncbi:MAG: Endoribonuclease HigB [Mycoplasmataceae bacterium]|nr:MAG: Endoribonuclease HigB [Mycoplasmataceae bacterium]
MIKTLKGKLAKKIWARQPTKKMMSIYELAWESLSLLDSITNLQQLEKIPGLKLHNLEGDRTGQKSFWVGKTKFRVCFYWQDGHAHEVEIVDYH